MNGPELIEFLIALTILVAPIVGIVRLIAGPDDSPLVGAFDSR